MASRPYDKLRRVDRLWFFIQTTKENLAENRISHQASIEHAKAGLVKAEEELRALCKELKLDAADLGCAG